MPPFGDWLVCGITTKLQNMVDQFDLLLNENDKDFKETGLVMTSLVRLGFLAVIPEKVIEGTIGSISSENYTRLLKNLIVHLDTKV